MHVKKRLLSVLLTIGMVSGVLWGGNGEIRYPGDDEELETP